MSDLSGWRAKRDFKWMGDIFEKWIECNRRYHQLHKDGEEYDDTLFFTNERPAVGILAGAAWMVDEGYAVQEYNATKRKKQDRRKLGYGREDIYIGVGDDAIRIEAKLTWTNAHERLEGRKNLSLKGEVIKTVNIATKDAKRYYEDEVPRTGMAIAHFRARKDGKTGNPICDIEEVAKAVEKIKVDASVWYFERDNPVLGTRHFYLGTGLFISSKEIQDRTR